MYNLFPVLWPRYFDSNGAPLAGGKLYSYIAGTSTPLSTFTDSTGNTPNPNPTILDADGYADVWAGGGIYKFILTDADDVVLKTIDNVVGAANPPTPSGWTKFSFTDGQGATDLLGETFDTTFYEQAVYEVSITRGTTVISYGRFVIQNLNGSAKVLMGGNIEDVFNGLTFSVNQVSTVAQLRLAASTGPGDGQVQLSKRMVTL